MPEIVRLNGCADCTDLGFVERQRTPERAMKLDNQLKLAGLPLVATVSILDRFGVERYRKAVHVWTQKADHHPEPKLAPKPPGVSMPIEEILDILNNAW
ncbi:hypothetical protein [Halobellus rubicundus]|uniref:Uncharacterized protein n=1 Tax=Halobellus rubicundus TaxID=2996466 RepID=A0ABD5MGU2_9EURY